MTVVFSYTPVGPPHVMNNSIFFKNDLLVEKLTWQFKFSVSALLAHIEVFAFSSLTWF